MCSTLGDVGDERSSAARPLIAVVWGRYSCVFQRSTGCNEPTARLDARSRSQLLPAPLFSTRFPLSRSSTFTTGQELVMLMAVGRSYKDAAIHIQLNRDGDDGEGRKPHSF